MKQNRYSDSYSLGLMALVYTLLMDSLSWQGWPMYAQLLIDLFKYLAPFLRNVELTKPMQILYKVSSIRWCKHFPGEHFEDGLG